MMTMTTRLDDDDDDADVEEEGDENDAFAQALTIEQPIERRTVTNDCSRVLRRTDAFSS